MYKSKTAHVNNTFFPRTFLRKTFLGLRGIVITQIIFSYNHNTVIIINCTFSFCNDMFQVKITSGYVQSSE